MTREEFLKLFPQATADTLKANGYPVGAVPAEQRKRSEDKALDKKPRRKQKRQGRLALRCTIIHCRHRLLDSDNAISGGTKALRDAIARMFGVDDNDPRIRFEYGQCQTSGEEGCIVKLERV